MAGTSASAVKTTIDSRHPEWYNGVVEGAVPSGKEELNGVIGSYGTGGGVVRRGGRYRVDVGLRDVRGPHGRGLRGRRVTVVRGVIMGKLSEELRDLLIRQGSVPSEGFRLDDGRVIMEDTVTTAQIGDGTEGTITFEEGLCGLECSDLTPEQAAWLVSAPHARQLITDALAVIVGWGMMYNAMCGFAPDDVSQYPMETAAGLIDRAHGIGMGV